MADLKIPKEWAFIFELTAEELENLLFGNSFSNICGN
jgi:hypothetical protein